MKWSRFNYLYYSKKHKKHLLYNAISNALIDVSNMELFRILKQIREGNSITRLEQMYNSLFNELKKSKILVESDEIEILKIKHSALIYRYSTYTINLTLLPTLACNFKCPYCFTNKNKGEIMNNSTFNNVIKLLDNISCNNKKTLIQLTWMGGEPLLNFKGIKEFTDKLLTKTEIEVRARLITNGYLMTEDIIKQFEYLKINFIQVTIDGLKEEHNTTRIHKTQEDSFSKIIENVDMFFKIYTNHNISMNIRVNLNKQENYLKKFVEIYKYLRQRYPYNNLFITPGFIEQIKDNGLDKNIEFNRTEINSFFQNIAKIGLIEYSNYPDSEISECAIRSAYSFVIGPKGELYSCWENIGHQDFIVGFIGNDGNTCITNEQSYMKYLLEANHWDNEECLNCFFFPICDGGCPEKRIRNKHCDACFDVCVSYKDDIESMLDLHYTFKQKNKLS